MWSPVQECVEENVSTGPGSGQGLVHALGSASRVLWLGGPDGLLAGLESQGCSVRVVAAEAFLSPAGEMPSPWTAAAFDALFMDLREAAPDPLAFVSMAYQQVREGGTLGLMGPFPAAPAAHVPDALALAGWCGFEAAGRLSLPGSAHPVELFRKGQPRWRVGLTRGSDWGALHELFVECFGHSISPALWQWKYGQGRGRGGIVWCGEQVVAHYGGMSRPMMYFGKPEMAVQIGDVMVKPSERAAFTRKGPFFLVTAGFLESYIGFGREHLLGFGFPNHRHMRLAEKLGLYAQVEQIVEISWSLVRSPGLSLKRLVPLQKLSPVRQKQVVDSLWSQMSRDLEDGIVGVRDWPYLVHRYLSHPEKRYEVLLVRDWLPGRVRGIVVLNRQDERCELMDILGPLDSIPVLIEEARRWARRQGMQRLYCWISSRYADRFERTGGTPVTLDVEVPTSAWTAGPSVEEIAGKWWLMSGDTDFR